ncbi:hypothetical protein B5M42_000025 [Paenibacillus athensensis]|uniref:SAF domain-containing protein n=1 Tax=Paenibacillus athensensis TaxID=1967502 RepID=A0A4Y8PSX0_9BACL|nr:hypothetical protein [Paenibacillus athensensis]MCD1257220.1 hypothetical protein [Paenibacillus athensensis]
MRLRKMLVYLIGILFIVISVYLYVKVINSYKESVTTTLTLQATRLIQAGEIIQTGMFQPVTVPIAQHRDDAAISEQELLGKMALVPIGMGEEFAKWKIGVDIAAPAPGQFLSSFKTDSLTNVNNMVRRGDRVDVWIDFENPRQFVDASGSRMQIGSVKIISGLKVVNVKTAEGAEVEENGGGAEVLDAIRSGALQVNQDNIGRVRSKPSGIAFANTYIMDDEISNAYVLGSLGGRIRLTLPNLYSRLEGSGQTVLTDTFQQLKHTGIFNKETKGEEVQVGTIVPSEVKGIEGSAESLPSSDTNSKVSDEPKQPTIIEVK